MNFPIKPCLLLASVSLCWTMSARAQNPALGVAEVLPSGAHCDHVIDLMQRHGVNNSVNLAASNSMLHHSAVFGSMAIPGAELGDLEVVQVNQVLHHEDACGPKIAVIVRNNSVRNVCNFHVTAVALLGRICPTSPSTTVKVPEIKCGEALEVLVTLPLDALAMGNRNGRVVGFQRLVVAIDSLDELAETNEANNVKAYDRSCLAVVTPTVQPTTETISAVTDVAPESTVPQADAGNAGAGGAGASDPPASDPLQSAIRMLDDPSGSADTTSDVSG